MMQRISADLACRMIAERGPVILDVRDPHSFEQGHIPDAVRLTDQVMRELIIRGKRDRPIVVCCYHGNASQDMARSLSEYGFRETYSVDGGYEAWRRLNPASDNPQSAVVQGTGGLADWLQAQGYDPTDLSGKDGGVSPLIQACREGLDEIAEQLLAAGADRDAVDEYGNDALWAACYSDDLRTIAVLLDAGIDVDRRNPDGSTGLMYAASAGRTEVVAFLLEAGANPGVTNQDDYIALDLAANEEILNLLRARKP